MIRPFLPVCGLALLLLCSPWAVAQDSSGSPPPTESAQSAPPADSPASEKPAAESAPSEQPSAPADKQEPSGEASAETKPVAQAPEQKTEPAAATPAAPSHPSLSQNFLPNSTCGWISVPDPKALNEMFAATQLGHLVEDEALRPLVDQISQQVRNALDDNAVQYGIRLSRLEVLDAGEICLAGILPRDPNGAILPEKRAIVLLVDVSRCKDAAFKLLDETAQELVNAGVTPTKETIHEVSTTKWSFPATRTRARARVAFQAIVGNWILATNEEEAFRQVLGWIVHPDHSAEMTLGKDPEFTALIERSKFADPAVPEHVRWYVEPFGYVDLARILAEEDQNPATKERSNNFAKIVRESGFDAIQGVSGRLAFNSGEYQILHRSFVHAPPVPAAGADRYPKSAAILDFFNTEKTPLDPEPWVPAAAASYATLTWNFEKVINHVHHVVDAITSEGSFERMLQNVKETNKFDVREVVKHLNNRVSIVSEVIEPIDANCEKLAIAIGIKGDRDFVQGQVKNFFGHALAVEKLGEHEIYYENVEEEEDDILFGDEGDDGGEKQPEPPGLIEKKYVAVIGPTILISNDLEYLKRLISADPTDLAAESDYKRVRAALDQLVDADKVSLRHFGRLSQVLRANYELARRNELRSANTILAQLIAQADADAVKRGEKPREFNGDKMPAYDSYVAPFLGPNGWVIESEDDGWRVTSCLLSTNLTPDPPSVADKSTQNGESNSADDDKKR